MADQRRVRAVVEGRVQGVFFRASLRDTADSLGLAGWVRNTPAGHVEAELQGDPEAVDKAVEFCRDGPSRAQVRDVTVEERDPEPGASGFDVL